ncbi:electron transfer flavoprotein subunit alpha/FixB family protein [Ideonella sp. B508-1]|uniref:electron transfer flavoprotein subunit alpha/FixB family protein n=1 Tax=Ideonella sp. B508-1 TaxID=137716 RepID=UPI00034D15F8|nr:FAD-binding protein [Ideonella sp. B508-1]
MSAILVLAEHFEGRINGATRSAVTAATQIGGEVHVLVAGHGCGEAAAQAARIAGVSKVLVADAAAYEHALAEGLADLAAGLARDYGHVLAGATAFGKSVLPRVAGLLDVAQVSDITAVVAPDTFVRPIYAGNGLATVQSLDALKVVTVRGAAFDVAGDGVTSATVTPVPAGSAGMGSRFVSQELTRSERPELTSARVIVSGGRGMGNGDNFKLLDALADKLGAAVGASRAAVDAGFVPNDYQVGQTGKIVAPELYIAVGISGAIQHLAGMKDSKLIVAINKDAEAPIFSIADYGLVADLFQAVPELTSAL